MEYTIAAWENLVIDSLVFLLPQVAQLSSGGVGGFLAGFVIKKIVKILLFFVGLGCLALLYLSQRGIISINYESLVSAISSALVGLAGFLSTAVALLPLASSFAVGFALGLWKG